MPGPVDTEVVGHRRIQLRFWHGAGLFALATAIFLIWVSLRVGGNQITDGFDDIAEFVAAFTAAVACGIAALRLKSGRAAWGLLAASSLSWAVGEAIWCYYDLGLRVQVPFPSIADVGFLAAVPLAVAGLLVFPSGPRRATSRIRGLLDSSLIGGSVLFVSWETVLGPIFRQHEGGIFKQTVSLAYPVCDVVVASLVLILATRPGTRNRTSLGLVLAGLLAFAFADSSFAYLTQVNNYGIGNGLDTGWVAGYLLVALGAMWALSHPSGAEDVERGATRWGVLGPYVPLVAAGIVYLWRITSGQPLRGSSLLAAFSLVLIMSVRQVIVLFDNLVLTRTLEARVAERTAELRHQAFHDALTGLANRDLFNEVLAGAVRRSRRSGVALTVLFVDLDGFKHVNDLWGHRVGDRVLQGVAKRFTKTLREADTIARIGGDEFAILIEEDPADTDPHAVATRLVKSLEPPFQVGSTRIDVQASVGAATNTSGAETADELVRNADLAMYATKSYGKHSFELYTPDMHAGVLDRMRTEADLRSALENDEFVLHYQPIVDVSDGAIEGVEALVRWKHPRRGLVSPAEFIPATESTGLIVPIGAWVLRQACRDVQGWKGYPGAENLGLSVNLSTQQLADESLVETVCDALSVSGLDPRRLSLEITESMIMDDVTNTKDVLERFRSLGIRIALDDFGTGYSSLSMLRDLPIDTLKIDRSFVVGITSSDGHADLARRILDLAADFDLHTVAEGVEEREQLEILQQMGCGSIQGFYFYKPLPAADLSLILREGANAVSSPAGS